MMSSSHVDDGLDALMQRVLDGDADERTRAELEARLAGDERLRAHYHRLRETFDALGTLQTEDPPDDIRQRVLEEIRRPEAEVTRPLGRRGIPRPRPRPWRPGARELLAFGAGVAAAALVAIAVPVHEWVGEPSEDGSIATLLSRESGSGVLDRSTWSAPWGEGEAVLTRGADGSSVGVVHGGSLDARVTVEFDAARWEPVGIDGAVDGVRMGTSGRVELRLGPHSGASLILRERGTAPAPAAFEVRVHTEDGSAETRLVGPSSDTNFRGQTE